MAETATLDELVSRLITRFPEPQFDLLSKIVSIAVREFSAGFGNEEFIRETIFDFHKRLFKPLLCRMIELGRIEPMDVDGFNTFYTCYAFGATLLNNTSLRISRDEWIAGVTLAFSLIMQTGK